MTSTEVVKLQTWSRGRHYSPGEIEAQGKQAMDLKVRGWSDQKIGEHLGLTRQTVSKRIKYFIATHGPSTVTEYREIAKQRYEALIEKALEDVTPENKYEAIRVAGDLTAKYAKLVGAEAPVAVDVEVHHVTTQEKELREMLAQAERDEKARESVIVEGQVVDG